jgi:hypothetical protein
MAIIECTEPVHSRLSKDLELVSGHLKDRFADCADNAKIEAAVAREARRFDGARIRSFIPVLVEHAAGSSLRRARRAPPHAGARTPRTSGLRWLNRMTPERAAQRLGEPKSTASP